MTKLSDKYFKDTLKLIEFQSYFNKKLALENIEQLKKGLLKKLKRGD